MTPALADAAPFIRCLTASREAPAALEAYARLIANLDRVRAATLARADVRARGERIDDALVRYNVRRVERFEGPLRLVNLARFAQVCALPMSTLLDGGPDDPSQLEVSADHPAPDLELAGYRIHAALGQRMEERKLSRTAAADHLGMDRSMVLRLFRRPSDNTLNGPVNRPVFQLLCVLIPLGLDLATVLRSPVAGEPAPARHLTAAL